MESASSESGILIFLLNSRFGNLKVLRTVFDSTVRRVNTWQSYQILASSEQINNICSNLRERLVYAFITQSF